MNAGVAVPRNGHGNFWRNEICFYQVQGGYFHEGQEWTVLHASVIIGGHRSGFYAEYGVDIP